MSSSNDGGRLSERSNQLQCDAASGCEPDCGERSRGGSVDQSDCPQDDSDNRQRTGYFTGQLLGTEDFEREQDYHRAALRRHNRELHGWGVVSGLEVTPSTSATSQVVVHPGYALDQCGREVIVTEPVTLAVPAG